MSLPTDNLPTAATIAADLNETRSAADCVALAGAAEHLAESDLQRRCLDRAIALDRDCGDALLSQAALSLDYGVPSLTFALLEEAARAGLLPPEAVELHRELAQQAVSDPELENYLRAIGRVPTEAARKPLSVVLVTNLFPPQELGGYGRMMWEFAHGLMARGHRVQIVTSDVAEFGKTPTRDEVAMERYVSRTLRLAGTWAGGRAAPITDRAELARRARDNAARLQTVVTECRADLVLAGNLDFLGPTLIRPVLDRKIPVLHTVANANPGYAPAELPADPHYLIAGCSDWNADAIRQGGYKAARLETIYPGARVDRFFRLFLPDTQRLRLCYASLMLPYKGADTLVRSLVRLHEAGIDFTAEIAGDAPDTKFLAEMQELVRSRGLAEKVTFTGFLDRRGLAALFARSNVLVFPSRFQEPFGISQVEAMAAGLVVVSSGTGGAREIVRDRVDGLLFNAGDDADLANKLLALVRQPEVFARLQRQGQARATAFAVENSVLKIETLAAELQAAAAASLPVAERELADARRLFLARNPGAALAKAMAALKADPNLADAHVLLGEIAATRPEGASRAAECFQDALRLRPADSAIERALALALSRAGRRREAIDHFQRVLRVKTDDLPLTLELARAHEAEDNHYAAEKTLWSAIMQHDESRDAALAWGDFLKRRGQNREALIWHRRAAGSGEFELPPLSVGRRHAVFVVQQGLAWPGMASVYAAFAADPEWKVTVVAAPFRHCSFKTEAERNSVFDFLAREGIPHIHWRDFTLTPGAADVMFLNLPYDETLPVGWRLDDLMRATPRLVYLPYALVIVGGEENNACQFNLPLQQRAWMVVAHSERNKAMFARHCATGDGHVVVTGHPKLDALRGLASIEDAELAGFAAGRKVICWNPHFDARPDGSEFGAGLSTFLRWQDFMITEFARRPDLAFVIRPHPLFFAALEKQGLWTAGQRAEFDARVAAAGNILLDRRPSYLPVFARSAALISDASSLLIEYGATGRPLLYLRNPRGPGLNEDGEFVTEHCYTAVQEGQISDFIDMVARGDDPRARDRRAAFPKYVHQPAGSVAETVKAAVNERLDAELSPVIEQRQLAAS
ncbi:MAG: glycosyltransferase [Opitutaceae bacterium]|nr:glycosyltransferase [Opitutaceae bacterium]